MERGEMVIDYLFGDEALKNILKSMVVESEPGPDHFGLSVCLSVKGGDKGEGEGGRGFRK